MMTMTCKHSADGASGVEADAGEDASVGGGRARCCTCSNWLWFQFARQQTPGYKTLYSLRFAIVLFAVLAVGFTVGGAILLTTSLRQEELKVTYSDRGPLSFLSNNERSSVLQGGSAALVYVNLSSLLLDAAEAGVSLPINTRLFVTVNNNMRAPVQIYVVLEDFFQNHKRYVRSVSYDQLHGEDVGFGSLADCNPQRVLGDDRNESLPNDGIIRPCGLIAWSLFNDTFSGWQITKQGSDESRAVAVNSDDLVWDSDRDTFFGNVPPENHNTIPALRGGRPLEVNLNQDEHFMAWMRPAAHPTVRKYFGEITEDLAGGDVLSFDVGHLFNTYEFGGEKRLLFTETSAYGNRNPTYGIAWLAIGLLSFLIMCTYLVLGWRDVIDPNRREKRIRRFWNAPGDFGAGMNATSMRMVE